MLLRFITNKIHYNTVYGRLADSFPSPINVHHPYNYTNLLHKHLKGYINAVTSSYQPQYTMNEVRGLTFNWWDSTHNNKQWNKADFNRAKWKEEWNKLVLINKLLYWTI